MKKNKRVVAILSSLVMIICLAFPLFQVQTIHASTTDGKSVQEITWDYLREKGVPELQTAAIMGNIERESGFSASLIEAGNGIGYGLCQWSFGRRDQLSAYARAKGRAVSDVGLQLDFLWLEFDMNVNNEGYANKQWSFDSYTAFMGCTDIAKATTLFFSKWERGKADEQTSALQKIRIPAAQKYYEQFTGRTITATKDNFGNWNIWDLAGVDLQIWNTSKKSKMDNSFSDVGTGQFTHPCPAYVRVSSLFGEYRSPSDPAHKGMDFAANAGTPIYAADAGTVKIAGYSPTAGNWVVMDHGNGLITKYMHATKLLTTSGSTVAKGQQIATVGTTGNSTGNHLHFQVEQKNVAVDPSTYLK